ncbi:MAG: hypothetical protein V4546_03595 [Bacteroidota bacterium]
MYKYNNTLLTLIALLLIYISILKTIEVFKKSENQYFYVGEDSLDQLDEFPRMKIDAKNGMVYKLTKKNNEFKWVKVE